MGGADLLSAHFQLALRSIAAAIFEFIYGGMNARAAAKHYFDLAEAADTPSCHWRRRAKLVMTIDDARRSASLQNNIALNGQLYTEPNLNMMRLIEQKKDDLKRARRHAHAIRSRHLSWNA